MQIFLRVCKKSEKSVNCVSYHNDLKMNKIKQQNTRKRQTCKNYALFMLQMLFMQIFHAKDKTLGACSNMFAFDSAYRYS